jgi:hypothetical protein
VNWLDKPLGLGADLILGCICFGGAAGLLGKQVGMSGWDQAAFSLLTMLGVGLIARHIAREPK